jgi:diguanylate cyclase (GGDEF)-like protein
MLPSEPIQRPAEGDRSLNPGDRHPGDRHPGDRSDRPEVSRPDELSSESGRMATILLVDDMPNNLRVLSAALTEQGYQVRGVLNGAMALTVAQTAEPDLILLDIHMPMMDGYEVCRELKRRDVTREIPVIFLSALDEVFDKVKAFEVGGVDYVTKPFQLEEILARVASQLKLRAAQRQIRALNATLEQRVIQRTLQLEREVVERQRAQDRLLYLALHDPLSDLPNRAFLIERLTEVLANLRGEEQFALLLLNCDRFRRINDAMGHAVGDQLLVSLARRLTSLLNPGQLLVRLGGDEFVVLCDRLEGRAMVDGLLERIEQELALPFTLSDLPFYIDVSIGIVLGDRSYPNPEHVLRDADTAMFHAKSSDNQRVQRFEPQMYVRVRQQLELESDLRRDFNAGQGLTVHFEPIIDLSSGQIMGMESLMRWQRADGYLSPMVFIPAAEQSSLIIDLDRWAFREACSQLRLWQLTGLLPEPFVLSVNLSGRQLGRSDMTRYLLDTLTDYQLQPSQICLELTESVLIEQEAQAIEVLEILSNHHLSISLDDFGTGYSSLSYLNRFPVNAIKIDRSFVSGQGEGLANLAIVKSIISLAHSLDIKVVAEGIETAQQLAQLRELGCDYGQGFWFSAALSGELTTALLRLNPSW